MDSRRHRGGPPRRPRDDRSDSGGPAPGRRTPPPDETGQEHQYLWQLRADQTPVKVLLNTGDEVIGTVTYFDRDMIKIEAIAGPSLFIRKSDIRLFSEVGD